MVGQRSIKSTLEFYIKSGSFPQFSVLEGAVGSGKRTLIKELWSDAIFMQDGKIDTVREMIQMMYKQNGKVFVIPDADTMSSNAKQALLKIAEEPPRDNTIILTAESRYLLPATINSRASHFVMDRYTPHEIFQYYYTIGDMPNDAEVAQAICETPGEVQILIRDGAVALMDYVRLVVDNIAMVSGANAFKIAGKVALKDGDGFDLKLFWKAFLKVCLESPMSDIQKADAVSITSRSLETLQIKGINKQMLMDMWILDIRKVWYSDGRGEAENADSNADS